MVSRTTDDYEAMRLAGCAAICEPAFWAGFDRSSVDGFYDYFCQLTDYEPKRAAKFALPHFSWLCINPKESEDMGLAREVLEIIPEWKDPAKAKAEKQLLVEFGQKTGFTPEELKAIVDHRAVVALRKAALYDQMMTKRKAITPVTNNGPRPAKPGAAGRVSQTTEATRAKQRLAKTGRVDDAASAIYQLLR